MKKIFFILIFVVFSCSSDENSNDNNTQNPSNPPVVETLVPEIVLGEIKFKGKVISIGSGISRRGFCWSLTINPDIYRNKEEEYSSSSGDYFLTKSLVSEILKETTYYVRAYVISTSGEVVYGENKTFTTPPLIKVNGTVAKDIHTTFLTLDAKLDVYYIEYLGLSEKGFCYRTTPNVNISNGQASNISTTDHDISPYQITINSLLPNTTYYVKAYIKARGTYIYSEEFQVKTVGNIGASGGYVYYDKGAYSDGWRYLEAAPSNLIYNGSDKIQWGCYGLKVNQTYSGMGFGPQNTARIISQCSSQNCAARLCDQYTINGLNDWFLPSNDELFAFYKSAANVYTIAANPWNDVSQKYFWSSTEDLNAFEANILDAWQGYFWTYDKNYSLVRARPVRRF